MALAGQKTRRSQRIRVWLSDPQNRLPILLTCFLALLALFLVLAKDTPEGQRWLISWQTYRYALQAKKKLEQALQNDPPMGFSLTSLVNRMDNLSLIPNSSSLLLVVLGNCEGCGEKVVVEWAETLGNWETWRKAKVEGVLVIQRGTEKVKKIVAERGWKVTIIGDEDGKIAKALNVCFAPRAYGFVDRKLVWLQKDPKMDVLSVLEEFLKAVKGEKGAAQVLNSWSAEMRERAWGKMTASFVKGGD